MLQNLVLHILRIHFVTYISKVNWLATPVRIPVVRRFIPGGDTSNLVYFTLDMENLAVQLRRTDHISGHDTNYITEKCSLQVSNSRSSTNT